jgi:tRNA (guanine37-N1)-methyltransferase
MKSRRLERLDFVSLFPAMFDGPMSESLIGKARERKLIDIRVHNLRDFSDDRKHRKVDDRPFGGGPGMVIRAEPVYRALKAIRAKGKKSLRPHIIFVSPQGRLLTQKIAHHLAVKPWLILVCGHYEGLDERIMGLIDEEISIGDYVLTGGELPAMVIADAVVRLIPGVVKEAGSIARDSFQEGTLDYPHYTRPAVWRGKKVPAVLLSGHHGEIEFWRQRQSIAVTARKRPDLLQEKDHEKPD